VFPYTKHNKLKQKERLKGFCLWLLDSLEHKDWKMGSNSSTLWLHGTGELELPGPNSITDGLGHQAGSGKSVLM